MKKIALLIILGFINFSAQSAIQHFQPHFQPPIKYSTDHWTKKEFHDLANEIQTDIRNEKPFETVKNKIEFLPELTYIKDCDLEQYDDVINFLIPFTEEPSPYSPLTNILKGKKPNHIDDLQSKQPNKSIEPLIKTLPEQSLVKYDSNFHNTTNSTTDITESYFEYLELVRRFNKKLSITYYCPQGKSSTLIDAINEGNITRLEELITNGAGVNEIVDYEGRPTTALFRAILNDDIKMIETLVKYGANAAISGGLFHLLNMDKGANVVVMGTR